MAKSKTDIAEATAELARLKSKRAKRQAVTACGVSAKFFEAVAAVVEEENGVPLETSIRRFLHSDEGEPYGGRQEASQCSRQRFISYAA